MVGITAYGVYVPLHRLDLKILDQGISGEKAIANFDEDSMTMGVAAGLDCLQGISSESIDGLVFATTTPSYLEKLNSVTIAFALNLRRSAQVVDCGNSLRAGTIALKLAVDSVKAGSAKQVMVVASDMRVPTPGSEFETTFGDGGVAFLVGNENVAITLEDEFYLVDEIHDVWRPEGERFVRSWEERFTAEEGYLKLLPEVMKTVVERNHLEMKDIARAVFNGPGARRHRQIGEMLGLKKEQVQDPMFTSLGNCGAAFALTLLAACLEDAQAGDRILVGDYGNGASALLFRVNDSIKSINGKRSMKKSLESKKIVSDYRKYIRWRGLMEMVTGRRRPPLVPASASALYREREQNLSFHGSRCLSCGYVQYPIQRVCANCQARDHFETYRFANRRGKLVTYGIDNISPTPDPPQIVGVVDFEGGGRAMLYVTDKDGADMSMGMPVEMTFRKLFFAEGIHNYFWKCRPVRA